MTRSKNFVPKNFYMHMFFFLSAAVELVCVHACDALKHEFAADERQKAFQPPM